MAEIIYIICALTSIVCSVLLIRAYSRNKVALLLWSGLCFVFLSLNNILLFMDLVIYPDVNITIYRNLTNALAMGLMVYGLVFKSS